MSSLVICVILSSILSSPTLFAISDDRNTEIPTSCIGLKDGQYLMKLINAPDLPIISVQCSNEYIIIDPSSDRDWSLYFTSFTKYHYAVYGAERNDFVNWQQWFVPSSDALKDEFLLSLDCHTCDRQSYLQTQQTYSTFYLSALAFGCFNPTRGWPSCDMDYYTYECRLCHWNEEQSQILWENRDFATFSAAEFEDMNELTGVCDFEIRKSNDKVLQSYHECTTFIPREYNSFKPSLGSDGTHCVCFKPVQQSRNEMRTISVTEQALENKNMKMQKKSAEIRDSLTIEKYSSANHFVHLTNENFKKGTLRILQSGTYIIDEDITFDFEDESVRNPLYRYWPNPKNAQDYPGTDSDRDPFFLGFFAGITIETSDVTLDLNGFELRMSNKFYFSQPFFSIIELASQPFLPGQGTGFFGSDPIFATDVIIRNGVIGLSSHHGIHGNYNQNIHISEIHIRDFQTHGIQLNGYDTIAIENVEIGPSTKIAYLNGNFGQLIKLLPTLQKMGKRYETETITFRGRESVKYTMKDLLHRLEPLMLRALEYAYYKSVNDLEMVTVMEQSNPAEFEEWAHLFLNPSGLSYGAVTYGILLNSPSAGIFGWHTNDAYSNNAVLRNVYIHNIERRGAEIIGFAQKGRAFCNAFNGAIPVLSMFGNDLSKIKAFSDALLDESSEEIFMEYIGDIVSDIHFAMYDFGKRDGFDYFNFGIPFFGENEGLLFWAKGRQGWTHYLSSQNRDFSLYCNSDAMFHVSKGLLGLKVSQSRNVKLQNLNIEYLRDSTPFGYDLCGAKDLYHFSQQKPYQIGFCMAMIHAITADFSDIEMDNVKIENIVSDTGDAFAISNWFQTRISYKTKIEIRNIFAGNNANNNIINEYTYEDRPNKASEACAIRVYSSESFKVESSFESEDIFDIQCIDGNVGCFGNDGMYTNLGIVNECENEKISNNNNSEMETIYSSIDTTQTYFYILITCLVFVCLWISKRIYHDYPKQKNREYFAGLV